MKNKQDEEYEELVRLIEEEADAWLEENSYEFEDTGDPVKPFRTEFAFESITTKGSRYKKWKAD